MLSVVFLLTIDIETVTPSDALQALAGAVTLICISGVLLLVVIIFYLLLLYEMYVGRHEFGEKHASRDPHWQEVTPPTFPAALVPIELLHRLFNAKTPLARLLNGTSDLEYLQPIKIGDVISVTAKLTRLRQVAGQDGPTLFMFTEITWTNQHGEVAVKGKNTYIKY